MAHLRKRGKKKWQIVIELDRDPMTGKRKRKYKTINGTKKEAEKKMAELIRKYENNDKLVEPKKMNMTKLMKQFLNSHQHSVAQRTIDRYSIIVKNHLIPAFGDYQVKDIKPIHIESYQNLKLKEGKLNSNGGLSEETVRMHHNLLSSIFKYAQRLELIEKNPVKLVPSPKAKRPNHNFLNEEQLQKILEYSKGLWIHDYIKVAVATGMRRGEMIGLEWSNVDLKNNKISIVKALKRTSKGIELSETKTSSSRRSIAITEDTAKILKRIKKEQAKRKLKLGNKYNTRFDLVFCEKDGRYCNPNSVTRRFKRVAKAVGLGHIKLHDLRHTMASLMLKSGTNPKVVQERLGHSSISITLDLYSHLTLDLQKEAAKSLSELLKKEA
ncbi:MAG: tyrosine-type recombinase/integrase [Candidatus Woesearchaeota archaeon]